MFIRKKKINGKAYFYLVETEKNMQKHLQYVGKKVPDNLKPLWEKRKQYK